MDLDKATAAHKAALAKLAEVKTANEERLKAARQRVVESRAALAETIVAHYMAGARVGELARQSKYSRESIRRILRERGIEADG